MNQSSEKVQEGINIRELIEAVWKGKVIIAVITVVAILFGVIGSFIIQDKYISSTTLKVTPIAITVPPLDASVSIIDYIARMPGMTNSDYLKLIKSTDVLDKTVQNLGLKDDSGKLVSASSLGNMITTTAADPDRISINVSGSDPAKTALIANMVSQVTEEYAEANYKEQLQKTADLIAQQVIDEEQKLKDEKKIKNDYLINHADPALLQREIDNLITQITIYKADLQDVITQIASDTSTLQVLEGSTPPTDILTSDQFTLSVSAMGDTATEKTSVMDEWPAGLNQVDISAGALQDALEAININTIQTRLINNIAKKQTMEIRIPEMEESYTESQILLSDQGYIYNKILSDVNVVELTYQSLQQRNRTANALITTNISDSIIAVVSKADAGQKVSTKKTRNVALAGILGLFLGGFIVLFRHYWRKTGTVSSPN